MREALLRLDRKANEHDESFGTAKANPGNFGTVLVHPGVIEAAMEGMAAMKRNGLSGGRSRARTADLLLARQKQPGYAIDLTERQQRL